MTSRFVPPGVTTANLVLRVALVLLPCAALALALPVVPHPALVVLVVVCAGWWARTPDHPTGAVALLAVAGWWTAYGVVDWRVLGVGVLILAAHAVATLLSYGPATLGLDPHLGALWVRRGLLALVPMPITYVAVRGLDPELAPPWLWIVAGVAIVGLLVATARLTQPEPE